MEIATIVLGLAALGGLSLAIFRLSGSPRPPTWLALIHGAVAVAGLGILINAAYNPGIPGMAQVALAIFVLAALGGAVLFFGFHMKKLALPIPFVLGHGLIAVTGYVLLLISRFGLM